VGSQPPEELELLVDELEALEVLELVDELAELEVLELLVDEPEVLELLAEVLAAVEVDATLDVEAAFDVLAEVDDAVAPEPPVPGACVLESHAPPASNPRSPATIPNLATNVASASTTSPQPATLREVARALALGPWRLRGAGDARG
jgi:hypothetical protein